MDEEEWKPKTWLGKLVKEGKITSIDEILDRGWKIREPEIVDKLLPNLKTELILVGQAKGKFGGGRRIVRKSVQKKTAEGNKPSFVIVAVVGNENGYVGFGIGKAKETVPAREKAIRNAKLNIMRIKRGCGSWECACGEPHSIPFKITGRSGSVRVIFKPAPKGLGLAVHEEGKKIFKLAGIKDIWSKSIGNTDTRINYVKAVFNALKKLSTTKTMKKFEKFAGVVKGEIK